MRRRAETWGCCVFATEVQLHAVLTNPVPWGIRMFSRPFALSLCASAALPLGITAGAHATAQTTPAVQGPELQEVTGTATRVKTLAERPAVSLEVYSSADLAREGIHDLASLAAVDPSLQFSPNGGRGALTLRAYRPTTPQKSALPRYPSPWTIS